MYSDFAKKILKGKNNVGRDKVKKDDIKNKKSNLGTSSKLFDITQTDLKKDEHIHDGRPYVGTNEWMSQYQKSWISKPNDQIANTQGDSGYGGTLNVDGKNLYLPPIKVEAGASLVDSSNTMEGSGNQKADSWSPEEHTKVIELDWSGKTKMIEPLPSDSNQPLDHHYPMELDHDPIKSENETILMKMEDVIISSKMMDIKEEPYDGQDDKTRVINRMFDVIQSKFYHHVDSDVIQSDIPQSLDVIEEYLNNRHNDFVKKKNPLLRNKKELEKFFKDKPLQSNAPLDNPVMKSTFPTVEPSSVIDLLEKIEDVKMHMRPDNIVNNGDQGKATIVYNMTWVMMHLSGNERLNKNIRSIAENYKKEATEALKNTSLQDQFGLASLLLLSDAASKTQQQVPSDVETKISEEVAMQDIENQDVQKDNEKRLIHYIASITKEKILPQWSLIERDLTARSTTPAVRAKEYWLEVKALFENYNEDNDLHIVDKTSSVLYYYELQMYQGKLVDPKIKALYDSFTGAQKEAAESMNLSHLSQLGELEELTGCYISETNKDIPASKLYFGDFIDSNAKTSSYEDLEPNVFKEWSEHLAEQNKQLHAEYEQITNQWQSLNERKKFLEGEKKLLSSNLEQINKNQEFNNCVDAKVKELYLKGYNGEIHFYSLIDKNYINEFKEIISNHYGIDPSPLIKEPEHTLTLTKLIREYEKYLNSKTAFGQLEMYKKRVSEKLEKTLSEDVSNQNQMQALEVRRNGYQQRLTEYKEGYARFDQASKGDRTVPPDIIDRLETARPLKIEEIMNNYRNGTPNIKEASVSSLDATTTWLSPNIEVTQASDTKEASQQVGINKICSDLGNMSAYWIELGKDPSKNPMAIMKKDFLDLVEKFGGDPDNTQLGSEVRSCIERFLQCGVAKSEIQSVLNTWGSIGAFGAREKIPAWIDYNYKRLVEIDQGGTQYNDTHRSQFRDSLLKGLSNLPQNPMPIYLLKRAVYNKLHLELPDDPRILKIKREIDEGPEEQKKSGFSEEHRDSVNYLNIAKKAFYLGQIIQLEASLSKTSNKSEEQINDLRTVAFEARVYVKNAIDTAVFRLAGWKDTSHDGIFDVSKYPAFQLPWEENVKVSQSLGHFYQG